MKINLFQDYELTDEFLGHYKLDDVLWFSYAEAGAMGIPGNIEAIVKTNEKEIDVYSGSYVMQKDTLTYEKVMKFFTPISNENERDKWVLLNMGLGNTLFVRNGYSEQFLNKYEVLHGYPYILYETWRKFSDYYLNKIFNHIDDKDKLKDVDDHISVRCDQFSINTNKEKNHLERVLTKDDITYLNVMGFDTDYDDIDKIIDELENLLQYKGIEDDNLNEIGIHCEDLLNKLANLDSVSNKVYIYVSVVYSDDIIAKTIKEPSFYYKTDKKDISIGDKVLVDRTGKQVEGEVVDIEYFNEEDVPYPLEKTKDIIDVINK